jgi:hypothetical protein
MHALLRIIIKPDPPPGLTVDARDLLAATQVFDGLRPLARCNPISNAAAVSSAVKPEYQSRLCRRPAMHKRIDAERTMRPDQARISPSEKIEPGPPHQRPIGEDPQVIVALIEACIHRGGGQPAADVRVTGRRFPCNPQAAGAERPYSPGFEVRW